MILGARQTDNKFSMLTIDQARMVETVIHRRTQYLI